MIKFQYEFNTWKNWGEFHITPSVSARWNRYGRAPSILLCRVEISLLLLRGGAPAALFIPRRNITYSLNSCK